jgi:hypothetical protein
MEEFSSQTNAIGKNGFDYLLINLIKEHALRIEWID